MKKILLMFLTIVLCLVQVWAIDAQSLIDKAKANSQLYRSIENSYKSSLNNLKLKNLASRGAGITAGVQHEKKVDEFTSAYPSANVTVTLPEFIEDLDVSLSASESKIDSIAALAQAGYSDILSSVAERASSFDPNTSGLFLQPGLNISKTFSFASDEKRNASDTMANLQVELAYKSGVIQFENNLFDAVINIMQTEQSILENEKKLDRSVEDYNNSIELGQIDKDSVTDLNARMNLTSAKSAIESLKAGLVSLKQAFKNSYGFEYEAVTSVEEPVLSFSQNNEGNSSVKVSYLALLDAQYKYSQATGKTPSLTLGGNVNVPFIFIEDGSNAYCIDADASLTFSSGNFQISAKANTRYFDDEFSTPVVSITGAWGKNQVSDINIDNLSLAVINAQSDYDNAFYKYNASALALQTELDSFNAEKEKFEIEKEYHNQVFEYQRKLYDMGYVSLRDYTDAYDDVASDRINSIIMNLKAMKIANEIKALSL